MAADRPWMKFYPSDWRADPMLRVCSISARGLWIELVALMHESERYGYLLVNGREPTPRQLSALVAVAVDDLVELTAELEEAGVFSRDRSGTIYSRRMIRDEKKAEHARKIGKKGGNPRLSKQTRNSAQDNGADKATDNGGVKPHMPEARVQKKKEPIGSQKIRLPDDWEPVDFGEGTQSRRIVDSWSRLEFERQLEAFRAHHRKEGSRFADWQSAWSTWVLNSARFAERDERRGNGDGRRVPASSNPLVDQILAEEERRRVAGGMHQ